LGGCWFLAGAAGGAGAVAYVKGELTSTEAVSLDTAWSATRKALDDLKYETVKEEKTGLTRQIVANAEKDKRVVVTLEKKTDEVTQISVRVGLLGDRSQSDLILGRIRSHF
jgi:hypothetical protein